MQDIMGPYYDMLRWKDYSMLYFDAELTYDDYNKTSFEAWNNQIIMKWKSRT